MCLKRCVLSVPRDLESKHILTLEEANPAFGSKRWQAPIPFHLPNRSWDYSQ